MPENRADTHGCSAPLCKATAPCARALILNTNQGQPMKLQANASDAVELTRKYRVVNM